jgi:type I restriction enzyme M protein
MDQHITPEDLARLVIARDKTNLDISWLKDDSLEDTENLQPPAVIASEIVELLTAALEEFKSVEEALVEDDEDEL